MYQGRTAAEAGLVFGHENMGIITEIGEGVTLLKKGDRIVLPFNVAGEFLESPTRLGSLTDQTDKMVDAETARQAKPPFALVSPLLIPQLTRSFAALSYSP